MYNAKTPGLPTTVGKEARIISKLQHSAVWLIDLERLDVGGSL
jgi:hypothetical protein